MAQKTLDAATATGVDANGALTFKKVPPNWTVQIKYTSNPSSVIVDIEGSLDGANYTQIAQHTAAAADDIFHISGKPVKYIRANLTALTGGTSPEVTVWIEASEYL